MKLTSEQRAAIGAEGRVIVSASAGSGKTFVMIERLVRIILSRKATVRQVLALTFTNKAAAQMRDRLRRALLERVAETEGEEREYLKQQIRDLPLAEISTIHAFCGRLVRTRFYVAGVDPAFRVISPEDSEGTALSARALEETFESAYGEESEEFLGLLRAYFFKKKDDRLREAVFELLKEARKLADYREVLRGVGEDRFEEVCAYLAEGIKEELGIFGAEAEELYRFFAAKGHKGVKLSGELLGAVRELCAEEDLFSLLARAAEGRKFSSTPRSDKETGETLAALGKLGSLSAALKKYLKTLLKYAPREAEYARYLDANARAAALSSLALAYDETYTRLKREAGVLDYDDLEQYALSVLSAEGVAEEVRGCYRYLFVDEYQDVNPAQERILTLLGGEEVFLVGDGKQAIYGFRGSKSEYFYRKTEEYRPNSLRLSENFRSAPAVLEAVNRIFVPLAGEDAAMTGGSLYGDYRGYVGFTFAEEAPRKAPERGVYSVLSEQEKREDALCAEVVRLVEEELGAPVKEPGGEVRPASFGDIAVLARTNTGLTGEVVRALTGRDIPVTTSAKVNACDFFEGKLLLDWLSYLDNAEQDVPMASAMLSAVGGFTEEELAQIRLNAPACPTFRGACRAYDKEDGLKEKLSAFFARVEKYRLLSAVRTATEMIGLLLSEGLEAQIAAKSGGRGRLARVRRITAESEGAGSVHAFLAKLRARDNKVNFSENGGEDAVKVLTMHSSKGLEYPIVIVIGMDIPFHGADLGDLAWTDRFLVAPRSYDREKKVAYGTVLRRASALYQELESVREERNLLYVSLTRARCRLHLVFTERKHAYRPLRAKKYSEMIDFSALSDLFAEQPPATREPLARTGVLDRPDPALTQKIGELLSFRYPFEASEKLPVKSSATALLRGEESEEREPAAFHGQGSTKEEGLAYHAFLQHVRFGEEVASALSRMEREGLLTADMLSLLDPARLQRILALPCFKRLEGRRLYREQTFLVSLPAREVFPTDAEDEIVFQGAIDLLVEGDEGFEIYDYKDSAREDGSLREHYRPQIEVYRKAVARAMRVDERTVRARIVNIRLCREIPM